jgi:hypothetical protein
MDRKLAVQTVRTFALGFCLLASIVLLGCVKHETKAELHATAHRAVSGKLREVVHKAVSGRSEEMIWGHQVSVEPCYWSERQTLRDNGPEDSRHVFKCSGTEVVIENEVLLVNQKNYGKLSKEAIVRVTDGKVFINHKEAQPLAQIAQK